MKTKTLIPFFALSFGITWGIAILLITCYDQVVALFGEISMTHPLFILAVYAPGFAGIFLVWREYGLKGLGRFFKRLFLWRAPAAWWMFLIIGIPCAVYAGAWIKGTIQEPFPFSPWYSAIPAMAVALFIGPIEEFGWRGLAQPLLQRKFSPFWAGLILGCIWGIWHIPAFLLSGTPQSAWDFGPYFIGVVAIAVLMTPLFNASRGSLLISALYHFQMMNPVFPDAQPWDIVFFVAITVIVVWLNREQMFKKGSGVTEVVLADKKPQSGEAANAAD